VFVGTQYALHDRLQHLIICQLSRSDVYLTVVPWREPSRADFGKPNGVFSLQVF